MPALVAVLSRAIVRIRKGGPGESESGKGGGGDQADPHKSRVKNKKQVNLCTVYAMLIRALRLHALEYYSTFSGRVRYCGSNLLIYNENF